MNYAKHYHNLDKLQPIISKLQKKEPVFISYIGNSNCATIKEEGYMRVWPEILTPELKCYFQTQFVYGTILGLAGIRWSGVLENRAIVLDRLAPELFIVYAGMRVNYAADYTEYINDLEKVLNICKDKAHVLVVTSIPMLATDKETHRMMNTFWDPPEFVEKHNATRELITKKLKLPCVDLYSIWKEMHNNDELESTDFFERADTSHPGTLGQFFVARTVRKAFFSRYESIFWSGGGR